MTTFGELYVCILFYILLSDCSTDSTVNNEQICDMYKIKLKSELGAMSVMVIIKVQKRVRGKKS